MRHTALRTIGGYFAAYCPHLTTVVLPDTVSDVGGWFLEECGRVEVTSGSNAVQTAAAKHNDNITDDVE